MKKFLLFVLPAFLLACSSTSDDPEVARWEEQAENITIIRDNWGIAHVYGKTDADAVFGAVYAQAEDDFNRVETNYLNSLGRLAEAEGESAVYRDLRMKLFINPDSLKMMYEGSPDWLKSLMNAYADGLNYYLYKNPEVTPRAITRFEPWMALSFTEGSIGGDIERVNLAQLEAFYGRDSVAVAQGPGNIGRLQVELRSRQPRNASSADDPARMDVALHARQPRGADADDELVYEPPPEPSGSNGIAIAPSNTASGRALLLINPHTSFYFRDELQMVSEEGLNAYGAVTWGQFFIYQGFNDRAGWMHTSSGSDNIDEYLEAVSRNGDSLTYRFGDELRPLTVSTIQVPYKSDTTMAQRTFTVYHTHRGPVVREDDGRWVSVQLMNEPVKALMQSYNRTKARTYNEMKEVMALHTNSSNNTLYANADGDIAYFHVNFMPRRDDTFDFSQPVDGSNPATDWQGLHSFDESPNLVNPPNGWVFCTNNWPWSAAGANSLKQEDFPRYVDRNVQNARGLNALMLLEGKRDFTINSLREAAYSSYLTWFDGRRAALLDAWDRTPDSNPLKAQVADQVAMLRTWDQRWSAESIPTSLAIFWGEEVTRVVAGDARRAGLSADDFVMRGATPAQLLGALATASEKLTADFGSWRTPWGDINRFQRITGDIVHPFNDAEASIPVPFTSARWGSLASFGARPQSGTKKWYGTSGNSFVAIVEFGKDSVRAVAVTAGGVNGDPASPHFSDQAERYAAGDLRPVHFYRSQVEKNSGREYRPGR